jgi:hypothetical protein
MFKVQLNFEPENHGYLAKARCFVFAKQKGGLMPFLFIISEPQKQIRFGATKWLKTSRKTSNR